MNTKKVKSEIVMCKCRQCKNTYDKKDVKREYGKDTTYLDPTGNVQIDFRYIYLTNVHFMFKNGNLKWYFEKQDFNTFFEKTLNPIVQHIIEGKKFHTEGSSNIIKIN